VNKVSGPPRPACDICSVTAGKWICDINGLLTDNPDCTVYSLGSNAELSFETEVLKRAPQCKVCRLPFPCRLTYPQMQHQWHV